MFDLPKLIIRISDDRTEICDCNKVKERFLDQDMMLVLDKQLIVSYDSLIELLNGDFYRDKEFVEAAVFPICDGG